MMIIGEKINGSIPSVAEAIAGRDAAHIRKLAQDQARAGSDFIDCCASVPEQIEVETLRWLIECVESVTDIPIALDSPSVDVLAEACKFCKRPGLINSVSGEDKKLDKIFPILAKNRDWQVIALLSDDSGIPSDAAGRLRIFEKIMARSEEYGISADRIHIDPLTQMLCTSEDGIRTNIQVISAVRERCPSIHITSAVSNISFNLPVRRLVNQSYTVLAMNAGLDSVILDPTDRELMGVIFATEALLGRDDYCMEYIGAYRKGLFGPTIK